MKPGDMVLVDFVGSQLHGKTVRIAEICPDFDIAHEDCPDHMPVELIMVEHPTLPANVGIGRAHIAGTVENIRWRAEESGGDGRQGSLLL